MAVYFNDGSPTTLLAEGEANRSWVVIQVSGDRA
jgi:hypothetical protein